jgi:exopolysaccharide biosynthesis protein
MRVAAGRVIAALCVTAALILGALLPGGAATASTAHAANGSWVPSTPKYWPQVVSEQSATPETITHGVTWHTETYQTVAGAQRAQIMNVDLADPNLRFGMVEADNELADPNDEVISQMANGSGAVAGVNADEFAIHATGQPLGMVVRGGVLQASPVADWPADLEILNDGQFKYTTETFAGTATDTTTGSSDTLVALNRIDQDDLTAITPFMGAAPIGESTIATATVGGDGTLTVTGVETSQTQLPQVPDGQEDLIARRGTQDSLWLQKLHAGDNVRLSYSIAPYGIGSAPDDVATAVSGAAYLERRGAMAVPVTGGGENNVNYPVIGIGVSKDGKHAIMAVFDGEETTSTAVGLTRPQFAQWMMAHGAYNAIEFDSGGSAEMVARLPGDKRVSVLNTPSDGSERPVANGLFIYSAEAAPGAATHVTVNGGQPLTLLHGTTVPVSAYATDAEDNPAAQAADLSVAPGSLARAGASTTTATGGQTVAVTAGNPGAGLLTGTAGRARTDVPLRVVSALSSLTISPGEPDLANGATQALTPSGKADGASVPLPASQVRWSVSPASFGTVSSSGVFTAAASGDGLATVTATAGGVSGTVSIAVGESATVIDSMANVSNWGASNGYLYPWPRVVPSSPSDSTTDGSISQSSTVTSPSGGDTMDLHYDFPAGSSVYNVDAYPLSMANEQITEGSGAQAPEALGIWVKGNSSLATFPSSTLPLANGSITLSFGMYQSDDQPVDFYPTAVTWDGWKLAVADLPAGLSYPLSFNYVSLVAVDPSTTETGDVYLSNLEALYSPRQTPAFKYTALPKNPSWLKYVESPAQFTPGGVTVATFGDSHLQSADHDTTGSVVTSDISKAITALPANAKPNMVQVDGNLTDSGTVADEQYGQQMLNSFGLPYHNAVGDNDIGNGADPENVNWTSVFGPTHYSYTDGPAEFIVTDSAWEGLLASDPYQVPASEQYAWLVQQLNASTAKDIIVVTHASPYDPQVVTNSQWTNRYEAQEYEQLLSDYQASHPDKHVILLNSQARGFAEQVINADGESDPAGLPNFDVSDAGVEPYAPTNQGGFYNYTLFHILPDGTVEFAVQPVLASIAVTAPRPSLASGGTEQLTATGTTPTGDNLSALQVPIADPASHQWASSDPRVAAVNPRTGLLTARAPGTATITVTSGGITGSVTVTVQG